MISSLEKLLGTPRDGALLRYSLGLEYAKAGERERAIEFLRDAVARDPLYSAAWRALGASLAEAGRDDEALEAYRRGIAAALLRHCFARLAARGIEKCNIFLFAENAEGRDFWRHAGWSARAAARRSRTSTPRPRR